MATDGSAPLKRGHQQLKVAKKKEKKEESRSAGRPLAFGIVAPPPPLLRQRRQIRGCGRGMRRTMEGPEGRAIARGGEDTRWPRWHFSSYCLSGPWHFFYFLRARACAPSPRSRPLLPLIHSSSTCPASPLSLFFWWCVFW